MRVLIISHMYPSTFNEVTGIFVHQPVKELQRQGCKVKVISPVPWAPFPIKYFSKKWKRYSEISHKIIWEGIEVYHPRYLEFPRKLFFSSSGKRMYFGIKKLVGELYKEFRFDIINTHVALPDGFAAMMVNRKYNKPLVVTIDGQDLQVTLYRNASCKKALAKVFEHADKIVTVSTKLKEIAKTNIGFPEKLVVINNGIYPEEVAPRRSFLASKYAGCRVILSVSHLIESKGLDLNITAISQLTKKHPNLKYVIIGAGLEMSFLRQLVYSLNLDRQVEFLGELSHEMVLEYMAIADIFSLPSWREGFGIVYLEAMAQGKPVIACQGEGITDVIENNRTGLLVKPKDIKSLTTAIAFLLENSQKACEIGERAKELVLENYTWEKTVQSYIKIYEELLANNE